MSAKKPTKSVESRKLRAHRRKNQSQPNSLKATPQAVFKEIVVPTFGIMRLPTVLAVYPVGKSSWWDGVASGKYPQPVRLGPNSTGWLAQEIRALVDSVARGQVPQEGTWTKKSEGAA